MAEHATPSTTNRVQAVVDASVIVAVAIGEPGSEGAAPRLPGALVNPVNFAEAILALVRRGLPRTAVESLLGALHLELDECDWELCRLAAQLHEGSRSFGLSLADCFCLASARRRRIPALTADRSWRALDLGVEVEVIR